MNEKKKPFVCTIKGCEMTFTNEDHLNWHGKKHVFLNVGLANKNCEVADQTPTPTRFIQSCEEVGLFQDLQNVNPFDEYFKKAVEIIKTGDTLQVHEANPQETLLTPHITPENHKSYVSDKMFDDISHFSDCSSNNLIVTNHEKFGNELQLKEPVAAFDEKTRKNNNTEKVCDSRNSHERITQTSSNVKFRIRQSLQNHEYLKTTTSSLSNKFLLTYEKNKGVLESKNLVLPFSKEKIRAMNRAAQERCRKKKAAKWKEMEKEIFVLWNENKRLKMENIFLKNKLLTMERSNEEIQLNGIKGKQFALNFAFTKSE